MKLRLTKAPVFQPTWCVNAWKVSSHPLHAVAGTLGTLCDHNWRGIADIFDGHWSPTTSNPIASYPEGLNSLLSSRAQGSKMNIQEVAGSEACCVEMVAYNSVSAVSGGRLVVVSQNRMMPCRGNLWVQVDIYINGHKLWIFFAKAPSDGVKSHFSPFQHICHTLLATGCNPSSGGNWYMARKSWITLLCVSLSVSERLSSTLGNGQVNCFWPWRGSNHDQWCYHLEASWHCTPCYANFGWYYLYLGCRGWWWHYKCHFASDTAFEGGSRIYWRESAPALSWKISDRHHNLYMSCFIFWERFSNILLKAIIDQTRVIHVTVEKSDPEYVFNEVLLELSIDSPSRLFHSLLLKVASTLMSSLRKTLLQHDCWCCSVPWPRQSGWVAHWIEENCPQRNARFSPH